LGEKKLNENYLVTQSNKLIDARHDVPLTAREQKIVLTMVSMIQPSDEDFKKYQISIKDFSAMLGLTGHVKYEEIKEIAQRLQRKSVFIAEEDGFVVTNWVASQRYKKGEGIIELAFSPELKPYLLQLKNQYTSYKLSNILSLKSTYSIRLYELSKKWQHLGKWTCPVEDLKVYLGATKSTFDRYNLFKVRVLELAINELNEKTDVNLSFIEKRKGRKVDKIEFEIRHSSDREIKLSTPPVESKKQLENEDVRGRLNALTKGYNFDLTYFAQLYQGAKTIWNEEAEIELKLLIHYVNQEDTVKNPLGFIKSKIKSAWDAHQVGVSITFADLKTSKRTTGKTEVVPDWFHDRRESNDPSELSEESKKQLRELLESLGKSPEEIEKKLREEK